MRTKSPQVLFRLRLQLRHQTSQDWWAGVQEQIRRDQYGLTNDGTGGTDPSYRGSNPSHRLDLSFGAGGVRLAPTPQAEARSIPWSWELHLTGFGYQGSVQALAPLVETLTDGNRLEYLRPGLSEWYINDERGLEQGFTVDAPPSPAPAGESSLVLQMRLDTSLVPVLSEDGQSIDFTPVDGNVTLLRYGSLAAYDAAGRALPARLELSGCGDAYLSGNCHIELVLDAYAADYPLTIDPLIVTPNWSAAGENFDDDSERAAA